MAVWYSLWSFVIFFPVSVCSDQEKSGNPGKPLSLFRQKAESCLLQSFGETVRLDGVDRQSKS
jgi:hypothetical protein